MISGHRDGFVTDCPGTRSTGSSARPGPRRPGTRAADAGGGRREAGGGSGRRSGGVTARDAGRRARRTGWAHWSVYACTNVCMYEVPTPVGSRDDTVTEAILLVGGKGTRLRPLTVHTPKPMVPAAGVPFLTHQLARARAAGVDHIVLATSYLAEVFEPYFGDGSSLGLHLEYVTEARAARHGRRHPQRRLPAALRPRRPGTDLQRRHPDGPGHHGRWSPPTAPPGADVSLHLTRVDDPRAFGLVPTDEDGPGDGVPGEAADARGDRHRPDQRGRVRLPALGHRHHPGGPPGLGGTGDLPRPARRRRAPAGHGRLHVLAGPGHARRPSSAARPTSSWAVPRPRRSRAAAATGLVLPTARIAADAKLTGGTVVGEGALVGEGARVDGSTVLDGAIVGTGRRDHRLPDRRRRARGRAHGPDGRGGRRRRGDGRRTTNCATGCGCGAGRCCRRGRCGSRPTSSRGAVRCRRPAVAPSGGGAVSPSGGGAGGVVWWVRGPGPPEVHVLHCMIYGACGFGCWVRVE